MIRLVASGAGIAAVLGAIWVFAAEEGATEEGEQSAGSDRYAELVEEKGAFRKTYVLPGVDPSKYHKIFFWEGQFEYRDVGPARKTRSSIMMSSSKQFFGIAEEDRRKFEEIVGEAFRKEIVRARQLEVIDNIADVDASTLIARGGLFDIVSRVPPEMIGRTDVYLSSIGEATFVMELMDAEDGVVVALVAERRGIETLNSRTGYAAVPANSASIMGDIRRWSSSLARRLRDALDKAIKEANKQAAKEANA
jgi:hypothetical protein